ncbi:hypothetical protein ACFP1Z_18940 [Streptomyces gamaensis]|uniref:Secreted protein n=1 Tax=Streptomyces gamaensis TaxID=1763542 RepID=A0ABW0Z5F3_9ACTN
MRRGFLRSSVWLLAMGAAVAVSWWGIRGVMSGTLGDPPHALVIDGKGNSADDGPVADAPSSAAAPGASPLASSAGGGTPNSATGTPSSGPSSSGRPAGPSQHTPGGATPGAASRTPGSGPSSRNSSAPPPHRDPQGGGSVKPVDVDGGRVVFDMGASSATLVSATPAAGWQMQTWDQSGQGWIRVTFTKGSREISVFCTWHDHPPMVETQGA